MSQITLTYALEGYAAFCAAIGLEDQGQLLVVFVPEVIEECRAEGNFEDAAALEAAVISGYQGILATKAAKVYTKYGITLPGYVRTATRPPSVAPAPRQPSVIPAPRMPSVPPATPGMPSADAIADAVRVLRPYVAEFLASRRAA